MLKDLEESDQEALGITGTQLRCMQNLELELNANPSGCSNISTPTIFDDSYDYCGEVGNCGDEEGENSSGGTSTPALVGDGYGDGDEGNEGGDEGGEGRSDGNSTRALIDDNCNYCEEEVESGNSSDEGGEGENSSSGTSTPALVGDVYGDGGNSGGEVGGGKGGDTFTPALSDNSCDDGGNSCGEVGEGKGGGNDTPALNDNGCDDGGKGSGEGGEGKGGGNDTPAPSDNSCDDGGNSSGEGGEGKGGDTFNPAPNDDSFDDGGNSSGEGGEGKGGGTFTPAPNDDSFDDGGKGSEGGDEGGEGNNGDNFTSVLPGDNCGNSGEGSNSSDRREEDNEGGGGGTFTPALNNTYRNVKMLLLEAPGLFVDGTDFKGKWRERYGTDLALAPGVKLKAFLKGAEAAGACRLEMRETRKGPAILVVHAPGEEAQDQVASRTSAELVYEVGYRVQAKRTPTSPWENATVWSTPPEGGPMLLFNGYFDAVCIPLERIRKIQVEASMPNLNLQDPLSVPLLVSAVSTTFEKAVWLLKFEASREKLASAEFDGVSVNRKGSCLEVCVRDRDDDEQLQAATELVAALKQVEANLNVSESCSLPGAVIDELPSDLDLRRLEREERISIILPKMGSGFASTDTSAMVQLVSDNFSDVARVQAYLSETYTSVKREIVVPEEFIHVPLGWLEQHILRPAEACHKVVISPIRSGSGKSGKRGGEAQIKIGNNTYRICGVHSSVACAIAAIEAALQATEVKVLEKRDPEPELVDELHKMRKDLFSSGDDDDAEGSDYTNKSSGKLLVDVSVSHTPWAPPPLVKVTLAMAPLIGGADEAYVDGSPEHGSGEDTALKAICESFQTLLDTFGKTRFLISDEFSRQIDANAATAALQEKLGGQGKTSDFAANCGLVKVEWNGQQGEVLLVGDDRARKVGVEILTAFGRGENIETVNIALLKMSRYTRLDSVLRGLILSIRFLLCRALS